MRDHLEADQPLSEEEVQQYRTFLKKHAPTSYYQLFPEDQD
jgi:hypothetical protein